MVSDPIGNHPFYKNALNASVTHSDPVHKIESVEELENFKAFFADSLNVDEDEITVVYDGSMKMTSPGKFGEVYEMFLMDENGEIVSVFPKE